MTSIFRRLSNAFSPDDQTDASPKPTPGRIYGNRDYGKTIDPAEQSFRRASIVEEYAADSNSRRASDSGSGSGRGRLYGIRDYKLMIDPKDQKFRRASIVESYAAHPDNESDGGDVKSKARRYSVPYGPRHYLLAMEDKIHQN